MSAYLIDPETIDYILSWLTQKNLHQRGSRLVVQENAADLDTVKVLVPHAINPHAWAGETKYVLSLVELTKDDMGRILLAENVRSVSYRYPDDTPGTMPGPRGKDRIYAYAFRHVRGIPFRAQWVVRSLECLNYQSCECPDYHSTVAKALADEIRRLAVDELVGEDAPWGVTAEHIAQERTAAGARVVDAMLALRKGRSDA